MKKILYYLFIISGIITLGCNEKDKDDSQELQGHFWEITPVRDRTELVFVKGGKLDIIKPTGTEEYSYEIVENKIRLKVWGGAEISEFEFEQISISSLKVENLYRESSDTTISYMSFKR